MGLSAVLRVFESVHGIRERRAIYDPLRGLGSRLERAEAADDLDALAGVQEAAAAHIGRLAHASAERAARDAESKRQTPKLKLVQNGASLLLPTRAVKLATNQCARSRTNAFVQTV